MHLVCQNIVSCFVSVCLRLWSPHCMSWHFDYVAQTLIKLQRKLKVIIQQLWHLTSTKQTRLSCALSVYLRNMSISTGDLKHRRYKVIHVTRVLLGLSFLDASFRYELTFLTSLFLCRCWFNRPRLLRRACAPTASIVFVACLQVTFCVRQLQHNGRQTRDCELS